MTKMSEKIYKRPMFDENGNFINDGERINIVINIAEKSPYTEEEKKRYDNIELMGDVEKFTY